MNMKKVVTGSLAGIMAVSAMAVNTFADLTTGTTVNQEAKEKTWNLTESGWKIQYPTTFSGKITYTWDNDGQNQVAENVANYKAKLVYYIKAFDAKTVNGNKVANYEKPAIVEGDVKLAVTGKYTNQYGNVSSTTVTANATPVKLANGLYKVTFWLTKHDDVLTGGNTISMNKFSYPKQRTAENGIQESTEFTYNLSYNAVGSKVYTSKNDATKALNDLNIWSAVTTDSTVGGNQYDSGENNKGLSFWEKNNTWVSPSVYNGKYDGTNGGGGGGGDTVLESIGGVKVQGGKYAADGTLTGSTILTGKDGIGQGYTLTSKAGTIVKNGDTVRTADFTLGVPASEATAYGNLPNQYAALTSTLKGYYSAYDAAKAYFNTNTDSLTWAAADLAGIATVIADLEATAGVYASKTAAGVSAGTAANTVALINKIVGDTRATVATANVKVAGMTAAEYDKLVAFNESLAVYQLSASTGGTESGTAVANHTTANNAYLNLANTLASVNNSVKLGSIGIVDTSAGTVTTKVTGGITLAAGEAILDTSRTEIENAASKAIAYYESIAQSVLSSHTVTNKAIVPGNSNQVYNSLARQISDALASDGEDVVAGTTVNSGSSLGKQLSTLHDLKLGETKKTFLDNHDNADQMDEHSDVTGSNWITLQKLTGDDEAKIAILHYLYNTKGATLTFNFAYDDNGDEEGKGADGFSDDSDKLSGSKDALKEMSLRANETGVMTEAKEMKDWSVSFDWDEIMQNTFGYDVNNTGNIWSLEAKLNMKNEALHDAIYDGNLYLKSVTVKVPEKTFTILAAGEGTSDSTEDVVAPESSDASSESSSEAESSEASSVESSEPAPETPVTNPSTGNAPIALAVIPVAVAAAAVIIKKRG